MNAPTKRQRLAEWMQKQNPYICCLKKTHLKTRDTYRLKVKGWKKIFHANGEQKKVGVEILILDKTAFEIKAMKRDKDGHYIMIKGSIQDEDITIIYLNLYLYISICICTQHRSTTICKANAIKSERGI